jgi:hypothetical protein
MHHPVGTSLTDLPFAIPQPDGSVAAPLDPDTSGAMLGLGLSRYS